MQRIPPFIACLCLSAVAATCRAADSGTVQLTGLLPGSRIIVDGSPVLAPGGVMHVPTGAHLVQIEAFKAPPPAPRDDDPRVIRPTGVLLFRTCVAVGTGTTTTLTVRPVPVYTTNAAYAAAGGPGSPRGPSGSVGPSGRPADLQYPLDATAVRQVVTEAIENQIDYLTLLCNDVSLSEQRNRTATKPPGMFWYSSTAEMAMTGPESGLMGAQGPRGPSGNPGDLRRLKDGRGQLVFADIMAELKLTELSNELDQIQVRVGQLQVPPLLRDRLKPIHIYTFALRARLDAEQALLSRRDRQAVIAGDGSVNRSSASDYVAPGLPGPPGPDGDLPADAARFTSTLDAAAVQQLVNSLRQDPQLTTQLQHLRDFAARVTQQTADAEAQAAREPQCTPEPAAGKLPR